MMRLLCSGQRKDWIVDAGNFCVRKLFVSVVVEVDERFVVVMPWLLLFSLILLVDEVLSVVISLREREKDSIAVANTISAVSGNDMMVPGSPQRGSCFLHHPSEKIPFRLLVVVVEPSLCKYACLGSDAAAQSSGIAANPLGVRKTEVRQWLSTSLFTVWCFRRSAGVFLGVAVGDEEEARRVNIEAEPYAKSCRSASRKYPVIA